MSQLKMLTLETCNLADIFAGAGKLSRSSSAGNRVYVLGLDKLHTSTFYHINRVARFWDILSIGDQLTPEETQSHFWNKLNHF